MRSISSPAPTAQTNDTSKHAAAARGAHAIATASGHEVGAVRVTWSEDAEADATALLKSLADLGFDNIESIPLSQAAQTWGIEVGRANEHSKTALCILEPGTATVMVVATGAGSVRTAVTNTREHAADLIDWLTTIFSGTAGYRKACTSSAHAMTSMRSADRSATLCRYRFPTRSTPNWLLRAGRR